MTIDQASVNAARPIQQKQQRANKIKVSAGLGATASLVVWQRKEILITVLLHAIYVLVYYFTVYHY